jgi:hypothetical protein
MARSTNRSDRKSVAPRGIALVAMGVTVSVSRSGSVTIERMDIVHDQGHAIINPEAAERQIRGAVGEMERCVSRRGAPRGAIGQPMLRGKSGWDAGLKQLGPRKSAVGFYGGGFRPARKSDKGVGLVAARQACSLKRSKRRPSLAEIKF